MINEWRDSLIRGWAGKFMMIGGVLNIFLCMSGATFIIFYDKIVERTFIDLGFWQIVALIGCFVLAGASGFMVFVGYLLDTITRDLYDLE